MRHGGSVSRQVGNVKRDRKLKNKSMNWKKCARTLSSNILKIIQHEGAELFDSPPVAGRAREAYS